MKKALLPILGLLLVLAACNHDQVLIPLPPPLYGQYTETAPVIGRTQLYFTDSNVVIRTEAGSTVQDAYYYKFVANKIRLIPVVDTTIHTDLYFNFISSGKFAIQDLYSSPSESSNTYMTFQK